MGFGQTLVGVGVLSFVLPFFGFQFRILDIFGDEWWLASIVLVVVGIVMMAVPSKD